MKRSSSLKIIKVTPTNNNIKLGKDIMKDKNNSRSWDIARLNFGKDIFCGKYNNRGQD